MTTKVLMQFKQRIKGLKLIPSKGGCFELTANGEVLYSKLATGRFPEEQKLLDLLESKLK